MGTKLNQIIAVTAGKKSKTADALTELYKKIQKNELFQGLSRVYKPLDDEGETKPPENKLVQVTTNDIVGEFKQTLSDLLDLVYTQDKANCAATADIVVNGKTLATNVPVTHLLFLEKQLTDVRTFINKLPVLDPSEDWAFDTNKDCYVTNVTKTNATKKVYRNHVKAEATDKHPAQVEVFTEDVKVGEWSTVKFSGAIPAKEKKELLERVEALVDAVKFAREQANSMVVVQEKIADNLLKFIFS